MNAFSAIHRERRRFIRRRFRSIPITELILRQPVTANDPPVYKELQVVDVDVIVLHEQEEMSRTNDAHTLPLVDKDPQQKYMITPPDVQIECCITCDFPSDKVTQEVEVKSVDDTPKSLSPKVQDQNNKKDRKKNKKNKNKK